MTSVDIDNDMRALVADLTDTLRLPVPPIERIAARATTRRRRRRGLSGLLVCTLLACAVVVATEVRANHSASVVTITDSPPAPATTAIAATPSETIPTFPLPPGLEGRKAIPYGDGPGPATKWIPAEYIQRPSNEPQPVYAEEEMLTLIGHYYPGRGFVALGEDPASKPPTGGYAIGHADGTAETGTWDINGNKVPDPVPDLSRIPEQYLRPQG